MAFLSPMRFGSGGGHSVWSGVRRALLAALLLSGLNLMAQTVATREYQVKAVFLFNFSQFVTWPTNAFPEAQTPLTIGVLGEDPFGTYLDETVRGEKVNGHPLVIQRYRSIKEVKDCQILFVSRSESKRVEQILTGLQGKNILTVSDIEGFAAKGGIVRFIAEQNKIHFRINLQAAKDAGLIISSKLLRLAEIVESGKD